MKHHHPRSLTIALIVVSSLGLGSCAVQTTYPQYGYDGQYHPDHNGESNQHSGNGFPDLTPEIIREIMPVEKTESGHNGVVKKYLCSAFVAPPVPKPPRVDLSKLAAIAPDDHAAVRKLLLDNILEMNRHFKIVEKNLKEAYEKHRKTCATREVIAH